VFELARILRESGLRVVQGTLSRSREGAVRLALHEGHRLRVSAVALVGHANVPSDELLLLTNASRAFLNSDGTVAAVESKRLKVKDLLTLRQLVQSSCKER
jgi:hypothetical protein